MLLYPKIKLNKIKEKNLIKNKIKLKKIIYNFIRNIQDKDYFILFMKKNFHF